MVTPLRLLAALLVLASFVSRSDAALAGRQPNIVFFFTDDQGYGDISAHGNPILKTPHLDRLRAEGVRFDEFHVSPTCAPTRSALFTGRHEFKNGVTHTILERERLTLNATTLAQVLRQAGYTTFSDPQDLRGGVTRPMYVNGPEGIAVEFLEIRQLAPVQN